VAQFEDVAQAVGACAFVTSDLPVILSLEMHCSVLQQRRLAAMLVAHLKETLFTYEKLVGTGRALALSPFDLKQQVLVKGKAKLGTTTKKQFRRGKLFSIQGSLASLHRSVSSCETTPSAVPRTTLSCGSSRASTTSAVEAMEKTRRRLYRSSAGHGAPNETNSGSWSRTTDEFYTSLIGLRSETMSSFCGGGPPTWAVPVTSISENQMLKALGLSDFEIEQIEGLGSVSIRGGYGLTEEQLSSRAVVRLAADPPQDVGVVQRRTAQWLLRPFPLGFRFSGKNMSALPGWLGGAQYVCLNFSEADLPVSLHFALFKGSGGYLLKPSKMRIRSDHFDVIQSGRETDSAARRRNNDDYWPPSRDKIFCATIEVLSLHMCPKRHEKRPRYSGSHSSCHAYHRELSGTTTAPNKRNPSSLSITLSIHPIGGFCAITTTMPLPQSADTEIKIAAVPGNGLNAAYDSTVYCVAAEPHSTFLRVSVTDHSWTDRGQEVAFEVATLGRLRCGYRVLQLRSLLGTRIELAFLFVRVTRGSQPNVWNSPRQMRARMGSFAGLSSRSCRPTT